MELSGAIPHYGKHLGWGISLMTIASVAKWLDTN